MSDRSTEGRITQLDGLRGIAIVAVFLEHAFAFKLMWMGVDLFFILSGFLITDILIRNRDLSFPSYLGLFYSKRVRRILPAYLLTLALASVCFGLGWAREWYLYLGLMNYRDPHLYHPSLGPLWSLAVEEQFYLLWPVFVYFMKDRWIGRLAGLLLLIAPLARFADTAWFHPRSYTAIYWGTLFRVDLLAAGALTAVVWRNRRSSLLNKGRFGAGLAAGSLVLIVVLQHFGIKRTQNTPIANMLIYEETLLFCLGVFLWALSGWRVRWMQSAPLRYLGKISYTFYLVHYIFLWIILPNLGAVWSAAGAGALALCYSALSWKLVEQPIIATGYKQKVYDLSPGADTPPAMRG